jgi:hypothetical protein
MEYKIQWLDCSSNSSTLEKVLTLICNFQWTPHNSKVKQLVLRTKQSKFDNMKRLKLVCLHLQIECFLPKLELIWC